ncbi:hypothetical protein ACFXTH_028178 [Malus domestica]
MKPRKLIVLLLCCLGVFMSANSDLASDKGAWLALRTAVGGRTMGWNMTETNPYWWLGVKCESNRVTELRFLGWAIVGQLPLGLENLTQLLTLFLRVNALSGPLPNDLVNLVNLKNLYLQGNSFSSPIPEFLFKLKSLMRLNLEKNKLSREISSAFNNLTSLVSLHLEVNQLTRYWKRANPNGVQFMHGSMWLHHPRTAKLKDLVSDLKLFGQIDIAQFQYTRTEVSVRTRRLPRI